MYICMCLNRHLIKAFMATNSNYCYFIIIILYYLQLFQRAGAARNELILIKHFSPLIINNFI